MADKQRGYVLDSGGLGALDDHDESAKRVARLLAHALTYDLDIVVPATALAQVYYDGKKQARLSQLIARPYVALVSMDARVAKIVGPLRKKANHDDVVDVHVAWLAITHDLAVVTSDPDDMASLGVPAQRIVEV